MEELIEKLLAILNDGGVTAIRQMPKGEQPYLTAAVTTVGVQKASGMEKALFNYLGTETLADGTTAARYGKQLNTELLLTVCCPRRLGAKACGEEADKILTLLSEKIDGISLKEVSVGECSSNAQADLFHIPITAEVQAYLYAITNEAETEFTTFILKGDMR